MTVLPLCVGFRPEFLCSSFQRTGDFFQRSPNMANDLTKFDFQGKGVRTVVIDGEPWFVAKDVCDALGYKDTVNAVKQHCRGVAKHHPILDALGRTQEARVIREPDLYRLVTHSQLPAAEKFETWVYEEVLPQIRKTGRYESRPQTPALPPLSEEIMVRSFKANHEMALLFGLEGNQALLAADKAVRKLHNISPATLLEIQLKSPENEALIIATEIGKRLNPPKSPGFVNMALAGMGFLERVEYKSNKFDWRLTDKGKEYGTYLDTAKKHSDGTPVQQIKWKESVVSLLRSYLEE